MCVCVFNFVKKWFRRKQQGFDEIQALLDEHLVSIQAMQFSPYKKPFEEEIAKWNNQLKLMSDILEEWMKV